MGCTYGMAWYVRMKKSKRGKVAFIPFRKWYGKNENRQENRQQKLLKRTKYISVHKKFSKWFSFFPLFICNPDDDRKWCVFGWVCVHSLFVWHRLVRFFLYWIGKDYVREPSQPHSSLLQYGIKRRLSNPHEDYHFCMLLPAAPGWAS